MTPNNSPNVLKARLTNLYLTLFAVGIFFPCAVVALFLTFILLDPLHGFFIAAGLQNNTSIQFFLLFSPLVFLICSFFVVYFSAQEIILTETEVIFKRLFKTQVIPIDAIVDFSRRYYYGSPLETKLSQSIAITFKRPITNGLILEIWYTDKKKIHFVTKNLSNYSGAEEIFAKLAKHIEIPEKIDTHPRSFPFYIKHHKLYSSFVFLITIILLFSGIWSIFHRDDMKILLIAPALFFYYFFSKGFFSRT